MHSRILYSPHHWDGSCNTIRYCEHFSSRYLLEKTSREDKVGAEKKIGQRCKEEKEEGAVKPFG
jgi:hypothetical protein